MAVVHSKYFKYPQPRTKQGVYQKKLSDKPEQMSIEDRRQQQKLHRSYLETSVKLHKAKGYCPSWSFLLKLPDDTMTYTIGRKIIEGKFLDDTRKSIEFGLDEHCIEKAILANSKLYGPLVVKVVRDRLMVL